MTTAKPRAVIYDLTELFDAVSAHQNDLRADAALSRARAGTGYASWMEGYHPYSTIRHLEPVLTKLQEWKAAGVTHLITDAPFSDSSLTANGIQDMMTEQFRTERIKPASDEIKHALGLG